jgi:SAM-dependent methyltransferase
MVVDVEEIYRDVAHYYGEKLIQHGTTANGVDWKDERSQILRFEQLAKIIDPNRTKSVIDVGCGYGAMLPFLRSTGYTGSYIGTDVSSDMIAAARRLYVDDTAASFECTSDVPEGNDVIVASGIFNVRLSFSEAEWLAYIERSIGLFACRARQGFTFNCLTSYSDKDRRRADLFYADPLYFFDHCKKLYARNVALLHDYELYEFTMLVRSVK